MTCFAHYRFRWPSHPRPTRFAHAITLLAITALTLFTGCQGNPLVPTGQVTSFQPEPHPRTTDYAGNLNIVVKQHHTRVIITNREPIVYRDFQLWLNQQYAVIVKQLNVGQSMQLPLSAFTNEHGESFPLGSILAIDKRGRVYQSEILLPNSAENADKAGNTNNNSNETRYILITRKPNP